METIRTYLESMFAHLPDTPEVLRAKTELAQMMEDKYSELMEEGRTENEAVGIVISEFGNLDELAEELGIRAFVEQDQDIEPEQVISFEEIRDYIKDRTRLSYMSAFGVFFLIISSIPLIIFSGLPFGGLSGGALPKFFMVIGLVLLFLMLAGGLGMLIYAGLQRRQYRYIWKQGGRLDYSAQEFVRAQYAEYKSTQTILIVIGIVLCVLAALPAAILTIMNNTNGFFGALAGGISLFIVGAAVFLFVLAGCRTGGFNKLLKVRRPAQAAGEQEKAGAAQRAAASGDAIFYGNEILAMAMPVYWPTILALYLIVSFLSFRWGTTWIIWPIAAIVHAVISKTFGRHVYES